ncbi:MAG: mechanosensitive ion channel family protein [Corynebacteriales bacterium]|nr:mechanosensitive ion channel family protein [Mycobacteriales bacterium]
MLMTAIDLASDKSAPPCVEDDSTSLCAKVWRATHEEWLANSSDWVIAKPAIVIGILLVAFIVRAIIHRTISRITRTTGQGKVPALLRPLQENAPSSWQMATSGLVNERREQRAAALGSILRSITTAVVFTIAIMLILDNLGLNLAPLLASAGVAGVALGFGAQSLVKDVLAGISMLLEDQYGVGDIVDVGEASGTVEAVGLRITTLRDVNGVTWHVRNGEVIRVGNKSQGWAMVNVDIPLPFGTDVSKATTAIAAAADDLAIDPQWRADILEPPVVLGVEQLTATGMMLRVQTKTTSDGQWTVAREMRVRAGRALDQADISYGIVPTIPPGTVL